MPRPRPRTTYCYSEDFKASAVRLSQLRAVAVQAMAESLYIHALILPHWRTPARAELIFTKSAELNREATAAPKELRRMKEDYELLKVEHDL